MHVISWKNVNKPNDKGKKNTYVLFVEMFITKQRQTAHTNAVCVWPTMNVVETQAKHKNAQAKACDSIYLISFIIFFLSLSLCFLLPIRSVGFILYML